ncbi:hypothetical protein E4U53_006421 [Claviceps sorghi]|nr:hypothetical protein E4U53_006421 [Claviceps sorghi]
MALFAGQTLAADNTCRIVPNTRKDQPIDCQITGYDPNVHYCGPFGAVVDFEVYGKAEITAGEYLVTFEVGCSDNPSNNKFVRCERGQTYELDIPCTSGFVAKYYKVAQ